MFFKWLVALKKYMKREISVSVMTKKKFKWIEKRNEVVLEGECFIRCNSLLCYFNVV